MMMLVLLASFSRGSPGLTFPVLRTAGHQPFNIGTRSYFVFFHLNLISRGVHLVPFVLPEEKGLLLGQFSTGRPRRGSVARTCAWCWAGAGPLELNTN